MARQVVGHPLNLSSPSQSIVYQMLLKTNISSRTTQTRLSFTIYIDLLATYALLCRIFTPRFRRLWYLLLFKEEDITDCELAL